MPCAGRNWVGGSKDGERTASQRVVKKRIKGGLPKKGWGKTFFFIWKSLVSLCKKGKGGKDFNGQL